MANVWCFGYEYQRKIQIIMISILCVITMISCAFIIRGFIYMISTPGSIKIKILYSISCILLQISLTLGSVFILYSNLKKCDNIDLLILSLDNFVYLFGLVNTYLLYILKLKLSYQFCDESLKTREYFVLLFGYIIMNIIIIVKIIVFIDNIKRKGIIHISKISLLLTIIFLGIYIISSIYLLVLHLKKSIILVKNSVNNICEMSSNIIKLKRVVKHTNCVIVTFITTTIVGIIYSYLIINIQKIRNNIDINKCLCIVFIIDGFIIIDSFINIIFIHLQFKYLHHWYIRCCNPFKYELNNILNKNISELNNILSIKSISGKSLETQSLTLSSIKQSTTLRGVEITHSNSSTNSHKLHEPILSYDFNSNDHVVYLCRLFPVAKFPKILL